MIKRTDKDYEKDRLAALVRIYRAAGVAGDYLLEAEAVHQLKTEFGLVVPCMRLVPNGNHTPGELNYSFIQAAVAVIAAAEKQKQPSVEVSKER